MARNDENIIAIAEHYGFDTQSKQCIEEMAELTQAICKLHRRDESAADALFNVIEELADVEIMVRQLKHLVGAAEVEKEIDYKIKRQLGRIEKEKTKALA